MIFIGSYFREHTVSVVLREMSCTVTWWIPGLLHSTLTKLYNRDGRNDFTYLCIVCEHPHQVYSKIFKVESYILI